MSFNSSFSRQVLNLVISGLPSILTRVMEDGELRDIV